MMARNRLKTFFLAKMVAGDLRSSALRKSGITFDMSGDDIFF
ncbi:MAG: hypothetical protein OJF50_004454 [Nitrospira sp.]|jgi:hypothetical protein|nr:hypothetical protein [Nitrospira sp.]